MIKILFVCLGNICRSATAEEVMRTYVRKACLADRIEIDSAGVSAYHKGELPDKRMRAHAIRRGYELTSLSRPVSINDFYTFDYIIGMDDNNIAALKDKSPSVETDSKISRMTDYSSRLLVDHVPDPYYGGAEGFENVLDILEDACEGLLQKLKEKHYL